MKKFNTRVSLETQLTEVNAAATKVINDNLNFTPRTLGQKIVFSKAYLIFSILTFIFLIGLVMKMVRSSMWSSRLKVILPISQPEIYKQVFENSFSNIKVEKPSFSESIPRHTLKRYRGYGIPSDAWITGVVSSPHFVLDDSIAILNTVSWEWRRDKQTHYATSTYVLMKNVSDKFSDLNFKIARRGMISFNKGKDMDNEEFNKGFWFDHNSPVKFRMLFTVSSQEKFVNLSKKRIGTSLCINKMGNDLIMSHKKIGTPFEVNIKTIVPDEEVLRKGFIKDLQDDIKSVLKSFEVIYSMQGITINK